MFFKIFLVIFIQINFVYNCDDSASDVTDTSSIDDEYLNIFRTIPKLFEYVMHVIDEKPEILERDDISVFTRESSDFFEGVSHEDNSRLGPESDSTEIVDIGTDDSSYSYVDSLSEEYVDYYDSTEDAYVDYSDSTEYLSESEEEEYDYSGGEYEIEWSPMFGDYWDWITSAIAKRRFSLTSAEIVEKTLEIEKQLEEYNNNKR